MRIPVSWLFEEKTNLIFLWRKNKYYWQNTQVNTLGQALRYKAILALENSVNNFCFPYEYDYNSQNGIPQRGYLQALWNHYFQCKSMWYKTYKTDTSCERKRTFPITSSLIMIIQSLHRHKVVIYMSTNIMFGYYEFLSILTNWHSLLLIIQTHPYMNTVVQLWKSVSLLINFQVVYRQ